MTNRLFYGDNLGVLRGFPDESVNVIYLDPRRNAGQPSEEIAGDADLSAVPPVTIEIDGVRWIEIKRAAKFASTKAIEIEGAIQVGSFPAIEIDGQRFIQWAVANRLKREAAIMRQIKRKSKIRDALPTSHGQGPLSAHREKQLLLPSSSGRKGRGWAS